MADTSIIARLILKAREFSTEFSKTLTDAEKKSQSSGKVIARGLGEGIGDGMRDLTARIPLVGGALSGLSGAAAAAAAGVAAFGLAAAKGVAEAEEFGIAVRGLDAILAATGNKTGLLRDEMVEFAEGLEGQIAKPAEEILRAQAALATFDGIAGSVFTRTIDAAADLSATFGGDLPDNATKLGTVLQNLAAGDVEGLGRGFKFLGTQTLEAVEELAKAGRTAEAQQALLKALEDRIGGARELGGQGLSGAFFRLTDNIGDFLRVSAETSGAHSGLVSLIDGMAAGVGALNDKVSSFDSAKWQEIFKIAAMGQAGGGPLGLLAGLAGGLAITPAEPEPEASRPTPLLPTADTDDLPKFKGGKFIQTEASRQAAANAAAEKARADAVTLAVKKQSDELDKQMGLLNLRLSKGERQAEIEQAIADVRAKNPAATPKELAALEAKAVQSVKLRQAVEDQTKAEREGQSAAEAARREREREAEEIARRNAAVEESITALEKEAAVADQRRGAREAELRHYDLESQAQRKLTAEEEKRVKAAIARRQAADAAEEIRRLAEEVRLVGLVVQGRGAEADQLDVIARLEEKIGRELLPEEVAKARELLDIRQRLSVIDEFKADVDRIRVLDLVAEGREDEAELLEFILDKQRQGITLTETEVAQKRQLIAAEFERNRAIDERNRLVDIYARAAGDAQDAFRDLFRDIARGDLKLDKLVDSFTDAFADATADYLSVSIFGDAEQRFRDELTRKMDASATELSDAAGDITRGSLDAERAASELEEAAKALTDAAAAIERAATNPAPPGSGTSGGLNIAGLTSFLDDAIGSRDQGLDGLDELLNAAAAQEQAAASLAKAGNNLQQPADPDSAVGRMNAQIGAPIAALTKLLGGSLGKIGGALTGILGLAGSAGLGGQAKLAQADPARLSPEEAFNKIGKDLGGKLDKLLGTDFLGGIGDKLGTALRGAQTGAMVNGLGDALGLKLSNKGAQIGGSIGAVTGIPGGDIIGSVIGGFLGKAFRKDQKATVSLGTDAFGEVDIGRTQASGKGKKQRLEDAKEIGGAFMDVLADLADAFGTGLASNMNLGSLGTRNKKFVFDPSGQNLTKRKNGALQFDTEEEAVEFALKNAIEKGIISGIKDGTKRILTAGGDFQKALDKAVKFENVFKELEQLKDPVGAELKALNREFEELKAIFAEAGASTEEYAQLEELYGLKRKQLTQQTFEDLTDQLVEFRDSLNAGSNSPLSLRDQRANIEEQLAKFEADITGGKTVDQGKFIEVAQTLLDIERQINGSTAGFFEQFNRIQALTDKAIANGGSANANVDSIRSDIPSPFAPVSTDIGKDIAGVLGGPTTATARSTAEMAEQLRQVNLTLQQIAANNNLPSPFIGGESRGFAIK